MTSTTDRSFSNVLQDIVHNIQEIIRSELRLAKTEVREEVTKAKSAGLLLGVGAATGMFATFFLLLGIVYALMLVMPNWAASFVVALVLAVMAGAMAGAGIKQFKRVHPKPERTVETLKENVEWAKQQMR